MNDLRVKVSSRSRVIIFTQSWHQVGKPLYRDISNQMYASTPLAPSLSIREIMTASSSNSIDACGRIITDQIKDDISRN